MELVLLIGIPATGKSTFARDRLFATHVRLNRDMLKTPGGFDVTAWAQLA